MRFPTTSQPAPTWDRHLDSDVLAEAATLDNVTRIDPRYDSLGVGEWQDVTPIFQRDTGDEQP